MRVIPTSAKCRMLRVASVARRAAVIPAISASRISIERPSCRRQAAIVAAARAAAGSNGRTRPS
jgi:hypothetical protein